MLPKSRLINLTLLVLVNLMWAAQYPAYKVASTHMGVASLNFWSLFFSLLLLFPFLIYDRRRKYQVSRAKLNRRSIVWQFTLLGTVGILPPSVLMAWGIEHSTASNGAIISLTIPVLMTLMGVIMLGERLTQLRVVSLVLAFAGTVLISRAEIVNGSFDKDVLLGNIVIFIAGIGAAFYNTYGKKLLADFSEVEVLSYGFVVGCAACAIISLAVESRPFYAVSSYPLSSWVAVLVLGLVSWGIAMLMWMWVLKRLDITQISVSVYLLPVFGVILSTLTLHEKLTVVQALGGALVFLATFLTSEWEVRRSRLKIQEAQNLVSPLLED